VVTAVDGITVKSAAQLRNAIGLTPVGQEVELTHERKGIQTVTRVRIEPGKRTAAGQTVRP
jgi:serine protease Do